MERKGFFNFFLIPAIYAAGVTLAIYAAITELHKYNNNSQFLIFSSVIIVIIIAEIIINFIAKNSRVVINMDFSDDVNEVSHLFNKIVIPLGLYLSIIGFGYYNLSSNVLSIVLGLTFLLFFVLFINVRAFFQDRLELESKTHFVYDFFKIIIFFLSANVLVNYYVGNYTWLFITMLVITEILHLLLIARQKDPRKKYYVLALLGSIIIALISVVLVQINKYNPLQVALCLVFLFYLSLAIIQHAITNTLTKAVLLEYFFVLLIAISILFGVS